MQHSLAHARTHTQQNSDPTVTCSASFPNLLGWWDRAGHINKDKCMHSMCAHTNIHANTRVKSPWMTIKPQQIRFFHFHSADWRRFTDWINKISSKGETDLTFQLIFLTVIFLAALFVCFPPRPPSSAILPADKQPRSPCSQRWCWQLVAKAPSPWRSLRRTEWGICEVSPLLPPCTCAHRTG